MQKTQSQQKNELDDIDFDHWSEVAQSDPEAFEAMRTEVINAYINRAPQEKQQRLHGLQWQIDGLRAQSNNPLAACIKISRMMWETLQQLSEASRKLSNPEQGSVERKPTEAAILAFRPLKNSAK